MKCSTANYWNCIEWKEVQVGTAFISNSRRKIFWIFKSKFVFFFHIYNDFLPNTHTTPTHLVQLLFFSYFHFVHHSHYLQRREQRSFPFEQISWTIPLYSNSIDAISSRIFILFSFIFVIVTCANTLSLFCSQSHDPFVYLFVLCGICDSQWRRQRTRVFIFVLLLLFFIGTDYRINQAMYDCLIDHENIHESRVKEYQWLNGIEQIQSFNENGLNACCHF